MRLAGAQCFHHMMDESMFEWMPQDSVTGGLPNITYEKRTPKSLGTETSNGSEGITGIILSAEVQEGKECMALKQ